ncbi:ATP-grasp domain-containing protein [Micromonospora sp. NBS 11-29]|uniref:ATP-grasp domain-containing protein n=1 Tax=Micromonospora sp. NBS 11-29 TaxID=1960879 RepID=UPI000B774A81|nr:ATP-grasp domain-containing protein [Micromonospora sp. NBS 11-29]
MTGAWLALVESNTTGTGRQFAAAARARHLRPVLLTRDPGRYPYVAEDGLDVRTLDTDDLDQVVSACAELAAGGRLAGITSSSEYYIATAARVAVGLGLPAPDPEAVARCRDKGRQRRALADAGVPVPGFRTVESVAGAVAAAEELGPPVVLKPATGSGSVGVRLCVDVVEAARWAALLLGRRPRLDLPILVEQAVRGPEFSVETFDGETRAVVAKRLGLEPWFVEVGHDVPAQVPDATREELSRVARRALHALGLGWGAAHTELRLAAAGPVVIEVNPRLAGGMIPAAVRAAIGLDLVDAVVARATGGALPAPAPAAGHAAIRFQMLTREGLVTAVRGGLRAAASPGVVAATALTAPGMVVTRTNSFRDRLACVVAQGHDAVSAQRHADRAAPLFTIDIQAHEDVHEGKRGR